MSLLHRHNWDLIDKTILPGLDFSRVTRIGAWQGMTSSQMMAPYRDKVVLTFKCSCGKVKTEEHQ